MICRRGKHYPQEHRLSMLEGKVNTTTHVRWENAAPRSDTHCQNIQRAVVVVVENKPSHLGAHSSPE